MLKYLLDSLEGVDESVKALYEETTDKKYKLKVDGVPVEDVAGMKKKNEELLAEVKAFKKKAQEESEARAAAVKEAEAKAAAAAQKKAEEEGNIEALKKSFIEKHGKEIGEKDATIKGLEAAVHNMTVVATATSIAAEIALQGCAKLLLPFILPRLKYECKDGKATVVVLDKQGNLSALTIDELKKDIKEDPEYQPLIAGSKASGAGLQGGNGGGAPSKKSWAELTDAERVELYKNNPKEYDRLLLESKNTKK